MLMNNPPATAKEVASYFIAKACALPENDLTNLKLQKMLYYAQVEHITQYSGNGSVLFADQIEAWQYGPVIPSVYNWLSQCGSYTISDFDIELAETSFSGDLKGFLDDVFNRYIRHSAWALVDETHKTDQPWAAIFDDGKGNHQPIPQGKLAAAKVLQ